MSPRYTSCGFCSAVVRAHDGHRCPTRKEPPMSQQLKLLTFDDKPVDRIVVAFAGSVELDIGSPDDRALFDDLRLGAIRNFRVSGPVNARTVKRKDATDNAPEVVTSTATIAVDSIILPLAADIARDFSDDLKAKGVTATFEVPGREPVTVGADA